jgi:hypothetical protein
MKALAPHMGATRFTRWIVKSSELPLRWDDALKRSHPAEYRSNSPFACRRQARRVAQQPTAEAVVLSPCGHCTSGML